METYFEQKSLPDFLNEEETKRFLQKRNTQFFSPQITHVSWAWVNRSGVCFKMWKLYASSVYTKAYPLRKYFLQALFNFFTKKKKVFLSPSIFIHSPWSVVNYHHWMVDSLPRLVPFLPQIREKTLLLPDALQHVAFVQESLRLLGIEKLAYFAENEIAKVQHLSFAQLTPGDFMVTGNLKPIIEQLKTARPTTSPFRKIYLSRQGTGYRTIENQEETEKLLERLGFEKFEPEKHSFSEQIDVFSETSVLIGLHGAGLTNCVFMSPRSVLYELHPSITEKGTIFNYCYWNMAAHFGLRYFFQGCEPSDPKERFHTANLRIDTIKLEKQLSEILASI